MSNKNNKTLIYARIETALNSKQAINEGFTIPIFGLMERYIVANTHNESPSIDTLEKQANVLFLAFSNVNVWGWKDLATGKSYIDISTSFDSLEKAIEFAKETKQIAIWDGVDQKEITINY